MKIYTVQCTVLRSDGAGTAKSHLHIHPEAFTSAEKAISQSDALRKQIEEIYSTETHPVQFTVAVLTFELDVSVKG